jgi:tetratricopeptide (TPR) repeat protein
LLGLATTTAGDLEGALPALRRACDLAPADEEACYYLARDLFALGHYQEARAPFDKALRAAPPPMRAKVHRAVAMNFAASDAPAEAERHFLDAIRLAGPSPRDSEDARVDYGAFLFRQGRTEAAVRPLEQAVHESPDSARANLELGRVLLHLDRLEPAVTCLERAVRLAPADSNAHLILGRAYLKLGRTEDGEREMRLGQKAWEGKR